MKGESKIEKLPIWLRKLILFASIFILSLVLLFIFKETTLKKISNLPPSKIKEDLNFKQLEETERRLLSPTFDKAFEKAASSLEKTFNQAFEKINQENAPRESSK